ncbi:MAG: glycosyltransferase [Candidatus Aenigmatarchaeota archaeon]
MKQIIDIIQGTELSLEIIGTVHDREYYKEIKQIEENSPQINVNTSIPRSELRAILAESKIGISHCKSEGFGIHVVECMKAGAVPVAYNGGGPVEILGEEPYLYDDLAEARENIGTILSDFEEHSERMLEKSTEYGKDRFAEQIRRKVTESLSQYPGIFSN